MSVEEDYLRLLVEIKGADALTDFQARLVGIDKQQARLKDRFDQGTISEALLTKQTAALAAEKSKLTGYVGALEQGIGTSSAKTSALNGTIRNLGFGISDVFSNNGPIGQKIQGFANNVGNISTGIFSMLGRTGPAALAAAAGLEIGFTAIGASLSAFGIKSLADIEAIFTGTAKEVDHTLKGIEKRIEELEEHPLKIGVDVLELESLKKQVDEIKKAVADVELLKSGQSEAETKSGKAVHESISEAKDDTGKEIGSPGVLAALRGKYLDDLNKITEEKTATERQTLEAQIADLRKKVQSGPAGARHFSDALADAEAAMTSLETATINTIHGNTALAEQAVAKLIRDAEKGNGEVQTHAQAELARRSREAGLKGLGAAVATHSPGYERDVVEAKKSMEEGDRRAKEKEDKATKEAAAAKKVDAAAKTTLTKAVSETKGLGTTDDVKADVKLDLVDGQDRAAVQAKARAKIRAALDEADDVAESIRDAVADEVSKDLVDAIGKGEIKKAVAAGETRENAAQKKADAASKKKTHDDKARTDAEKKEAETLAKQYSAGSDVDEQAAALAQQVHAAGGATNEKTGRFVPMTPQQQERYLQAAVAHYLRSQFGVSAQNAELASGPLAMQSLGGLSPIAAPAPSERPRPRPKPRPAPRPATKPQPSPGSGLKAAAKPSTIRRAPLPAPAVATVAPAGGQQTAPDAGATLPAVPKPGPKAAPRRGRWPGDRGTDAPRPALKPPVNPAVAAAKAQQDAAQAARQKRTAKMIADQKRQDAARNNRLGQDQASNTQLPLNDQLVANQAKLATRQAELDAKLKRTLALAQQVGRFSDQQTRSNQNSGSV